MLVEPKLDEIVNGHRGMLKGIRICLEKQCLVSAVTLMFSSIDALAALTRPVTQQSTDSVVFKNWATRFIKPEDKLGCTAIDLWSARCGVLHLYSTESDLTNQNKAKRLYYQWNKGPRADTVVTLPTGAFVIAVEDLHSSVENAAKEFIVASEMDDNIKQLVSAHLPTLLCYEPFPILAVANAA